MSCVGTIAPARASLSIAVLLLAPGLGHSVHEPRRVLSLDPLERQQGYGEEQALGLAPAGLRRGGGGGTGSRAGAGRSAGGGRGRRRRRGADRWAGRRARRLAWRRRRQRYQRRARGGDVL